MVKYNIIIFYILYCCNSFSQSLPRIPGTNRHYQQGDWITYSTTRFVRNIGIGHEYVYFATTGGITRYNFFSNRWSWPYTISNGLASNNIFIVALDFNTGYLWCTTEYSLSYMEPASKLWYNIYFDELGLGIDDQLISIGFGDNNVYAVSASNKQFVSNNSSIMFSRTNENLNNNIKWYSEDNKSTNKLPHFFVPEGYLFDERNLYIEDFQMRKYKITCWVQDQWKNVWIGTWGLGASKGDLNTYWLDILKYGLWDNTVDAIETKDERFWIGGIQGHKEPAGVTEWNIPNGVPYYYEPYLITGFDSDEITSIKADDQTIWFGTTNGLTRYDEQEKIWETFTIVDNLVDNWVKDITIDNKYIWVGTVSGMSKIEKSSLGTDSTRITHVLYPSLGNIIIHDLDQQQNLIWMATEFGIFVYDKAKQEGGFYSGAVGPSDQVTYAVSVHKDEVWFGTEEGVSGFNSSKKQWLDPPARLYKTEGVINKILASEQAVWVATNNGVLKYDRQRQKWVQFTVLDGLPSNQIYSLVLQKDYIWFGTRNGLTTFYWNSPYRID